MTDFEAIRSDASLQYDFLRKVGLAAEDFQERDYKSFNPYLVLRNPSLNVFDKLDNFFKGSTLSKCPLPNTTVNDHCYRQFGNVHVRWFPNAGELQMSLHESQWRK